MTATSAERGAAAFASAAGLVPGPDGHFGRFGGRFVPEALIKALDELDAVYRHAMADEAFQVEFARLLRDYAGVPSKLYDATRLSTEVGTGARFLLKREDLNHTGAHKIRNVLGQALITQRMGKKRIIAETGAGQHGVAQRDRRRPVRFRMRRLHGRGRHPPAGAERRADADARCHRRAGHPRFEDAQGRDERGAARLGRQRRDHSLPARYGGRTAPVPGHGPRFRTRHRSRDPGAVPRPHRAAPGCRMRVCGRRVERDRHLPRVHPGLVGRALRLRGRRRRRRDRPARRGDLGRRGRRAPRHAQLRPAERGRADDRVALHLGRPGLSGRRTRARVAGRRRSGRLPVRDRPRGDGRVRAAVPDRRDHPRDRERARAGRCDPHRAAARSRTPRSSSTCPAAATRTSRRPANGSASSTTRRRRCDGPERRRPARDADRRGTSPGATAARRATFRSCSTRRRPRTAVSSSVACRPVSRRSSAASSRCGRWSTPARTSSRSNSPTPIRSWTARSSSARARSRWPAAYGQPT